MKHVFLQQSGMDGTDQHSSSGHRHFVSLAELQVKGAAASLQLMRDWCPHDHCHLHPKVWLVKRIAYTGQT